MTHTPKQKKAIEITCENNKMLALSQKYFKVDIINMFTKLNETMMKEIKEDMVTIWHQIENIMKRYRKKEQNGKFWS